MRLYRDTLELTPIISASRRTDLPRFHVDYLADKLSGLRKKSVVVLWTKDPENIYQHAALRTAVSKHNSVVLITITGMGGWPIESAVPSWEQVVEHTRKLITFLGNPDKVRVRFDPLVYFEDGKNNIDLFPRVSKTVSELGVKHIITKFLCFYPQVKKGLQESGIKLIDPPLDTKLTGLKKMAGEARKLGITLYSCCSLTAEEVKQSSCISAEWLSGLYNISLNTRKDPSQRKACNCVVSRDIGSYSQICCSGCAYCYAQRGGTFNYLKQRHMAHEQGTS